MTGPQSNKIFAAVLIAGITAYLAAFIADRIVVPKPLETAAISIEGGEVESGAIAGPSGPEPIMHLIASADIAQGEKLSKACAACHSFDNGGPDKVGPNLYDVVGGPTAHKSGFAYSEGLANMNATWGYDELNHFLYKPKSYIEGTKMNYIGMKKPEDRAAMIAWLRTLSPSPVAEPSEAQIIAEKAALAPEPSEGEGELNTTSVAGSTDEMQEAPESAEETPENEVATDSGSENQVAEPAEAETEAETEPEGESAEAEQGNQE